MFYRRPDNLSGVTGNRGVRFLWVLLSFVQAGSVCGQDAPVHLPATSPSPTATVSTGVDIRFTESSFPVAREGYVSLEWNVVESAAAYRVVNQAGESAYEGSFPRAFISGLSNGDYQFAVTALDANGTVMGRTSAPAVVQVEHWPLPQALGLFALGLVVFMILIGLLMHGTHITGQTRQRAVAEEAHP